MPHEHGRPKAIDVAAFVAESANSNEEEAEDGGGVAGKKSEAEKNTAASGSSAPKGSEKRKRVTRPAHDEFDVTDKYNQVRSDHTNFHFTLHSSSG